MAFGRYILEGQPDKLVYHQSLIREYWQCEKRFKIACTTNVELSSKAMDLGNIFERLVFGDFDNTLNTYLPKSGKGRDAVEKVAAYVKKEYFPGMVLDEKNTQVQVMVDMGEFGFGGALDYYGPFMEYEEVIADTKYVENIKRSSYHNSQSMHPSEYIQQISYIYMMWRKTGRIIPFIKLVCEGKHSDNPIIKKQVFEADEKVFKWFEKTMTRIHRKQKYNACHATDDEDTCFSRAFGRCRYLEFCEEGRERVEGWTDTFKLSQII